MVDIYGGLEGDHRPVCAHCQTAWPCAHNEGLTRPHARAGDRCDRCDMPWPCAAAVLGGTEQMMRDTDDTEETGNAQLATGVGPDE